MTEYMLNRKDIITLEKRIVSALETLVAIDGYSVLFPKSAGSLEASWYPDEHKLLLPLYTAETVLALFVLRTTDQERAACVQSLWAGLNGILLSNLVSFKKSQCDPVTGLYNRAVLLETIGRSMELLRMSFDTGHSDEHFAAAGHLNLFKYSNGRPITGGSFGLMVLRLHNLRRIIRDFGYTFGDRFLKGFAAFLQSIVPDASLLARTGDEEYAIFFPLCTARQCKETAAGVLKAIPKFRMAAPATGENLHMLASAGYVVFPFDIDGALCRQPIYDQAHVFLRRGRVAAAMADIDAINPLGYAEILESGGRVQELLPYSRVLLNFGSNMGVRQGQVFGVFGAGEQAQYKGDIFIVDVNAGSAVAEVLFIASPSATICAGDKLRLKTEGSEASFKQENVALSGESDALIMGYGDFFIAWGKEREKYQNYAMALLTLDYLPDCAEIAFDDLAEQSAPNTGNSPETNNVLEVGLEFCANHFKDNALIGRYAANSLILFHPGSVGQDILDSYHELARKLEQNNGLMMTAGIAPYPYLDFRKTDSIDNSRKAWEYARLLPGPQVGLLDSLALNISADKLFSQGEAFGAVQEFQRALVADNSNSLAWNSLGICMAGLGKYGEAERNFLEALRYDPNDSMAFYNLGYMAQAQGREADARSYYEQCLSKNPGHTFAHIRLGQLAEQLENWQEAREWYEKARAISQGDGMVFRHFARLCLKEDRVDEAREHLHEALIADPYDAFSMQLLAKIFLDSGEDPELAASLARKSVNMQPGNKAGWLELARALDAMGETEQAKAAELRAAEIEP